MSMEMLSIYCGPERRNGGGDKKKEREIVLMPERKDASGMHDLQW